MENEAIKTELGKLNSQQRAKLRRAFPGRRSISYAAVDDSFDNGHRAIEFKFEGNNLTRYAFLGPRGRVIKIIDPYSGTNAR